MSGLCVPVVQHNEVLMHILTTQMYILDFQNYWTFPLIIFFSGNKNKYDDYSILADCWKSVSCLIVNYLVTYKQILPFRMQMFVLRYAECYRTSVRGTQCFLRQTNFQFANAEKKKNNLRRTQNVNKYNFIFVYAFLQMIYIKVM